LDINESPQIPLGKRFDLSLAASDDGDPPQPDIDDPKGAGRSDTDHPKALKALLREVPHHDYAATAAKAPELVADLEAGTDSPVADPSHAQHPPSFLTADDIDNYIWEIDQRLYNRELQQGRSPTPPPPSLAPRAQANGHGAAGATNGHGTKEASSAVGGPGSSANREFVLRNPTSVYNWLRKHEPKVFLQDGEDKDNGDEHGGGGSGAAGGGGGGRGRKSAGEKGSGRAPGSRSSKRASAAHVREKRGSHAHAAAAEDGEDVEEDLGFELVTPSGPGKGKRKRNIDDDAGYRPKGGSNRPTKRKRKSEGGEVTTPTTVSKRGPRKSEASAPPDHDGTERDD